MPTELVNIDFDNATAGNQDLYVAYPDFVASSDNTAAWVVRPAEDDVGQGLAGIFSPVTCNTAEVTDDDQYCEITVSASTLGGSWCGPAVRCQTLADAIGGGNTAGTSMYVRVRADGAVRTGSLYRQDANGDVTVVSTFSPGALPTEAVLRLEAEGSTYRFYINGNLELTATDATITGGFPGIHSWGSGYIDSFRSGNLSAEGPNTGSSNAQAPAGIHAGSGTVLITGSGVATSVASTHFGFETIPTATGSSNAQAAASTHSGSGAVFSEFQDPTDLTITPVIVPTRLIGPAPLGVFFDGTGTTRTDTSDPFHDLHHSWDFGDVGSNYNTAIGAVTGHVFETPGDYTVTYTVVGPTGKNETTVDITVQDPDVVFAGSLTTVVSTDGDFTGAPAGAIQVQSSDAGAVLTSSVHGWAPGRRVLFKRGQSFSYSSRINFFNLAALPSLISAWGPISGTDAQGISDNAPILNATFSGACIRFQTRGMSVSDIDFRGTGSNILAECLRGDNRDELWHKLRVTTGMGQGIYYNEGVLAFYPNDSAPSGVGIAQCEFSGLSNYSLYGAAHNTFYTGNYTHDFTLSHLVRCPYYYKMSIHDNIMDNPGQQGFAVLKMHGSQTPNLAPNVQEYSEFLCVTNNDLRGDGGIPVELAVQGFGRLVSGTPDAPDEVREGDRCRNVMAEGNIVRLFGNAAPAFFVGAENVTIRNNIVLVEPGKFSNGAFIAEIQAVDTRINPQGTPAQFDSISKTWGPYRIYNNTLYSNHPSSAQTVSVLNTPDGGNHPGTLVANNLIVTTQNPPLLEHRNTGLSTGISTSNNFLNTPGVFIEDIATEDFRLPEISPAVDAGVALPVYYDFYRNRRSDGTLDVGAVEFTGVDNIVGILGSGNHTAAASTHAGAGGVEITGSGSHGSGDGDATHSGFGLVVISGSGVHQGRNGTHEGFSVEVPVGSSVADAAASTHSGSGQVLIVGSGTHTAVPSSHGGSSYPIITGSGVHTALASTHTGSGAKVSLGSGTHGDVAGTHSGTGSVPAQGSGAHTGLGSTHTGFGAQVILGFSSPEAARAETHTGSGEVFIAGVGVHVGLESVASGTGQVIVSGSSSPASIPGTHTGFALGVILIIEANDTVQVSSSNNQLRLINKSVTETVSITESLFRTRQLVRTINLLMDLQDRADTDKNIRLEELNSIVLLIEKVQQTLQEVRELDSAIINKFRRDRYLYDNEGEGEFQWRATRYIDKNNNS